MLLSSLDQIGLNNNLIIPSEKFPQGESTFISAALRPQRVRDCGRKYQTKYTGQSIQTVFFLQSNKCALKMYHMF